MGVHIQQNTHLHVLAYNMKRMMNIMGIGGLIEAIQA